MGKKRKKKEEKKKRKKRKRKEDEEVEEERSQRKEEKRENHKGKAKKPLQKTPKVNSSKLTLTPENIADKGSFNTNLYKISN